MVIHQNNIHNINFNFHFLLDIHNFIYHFYLNIYHPNMKAGWYQTNFGAIKKIKNILNKDWGWSVWYIKVGSRIIWTMKRWIRITTTVGSNARADWSHEDSTCRKRAWISCGAATAVSLTRLTPRVWSFQVDSAGIQQQTINSHSLNKPVFPYSTKTKMRKIRYRSIKSKDNCFMTSMKLF